MELDKRVGDYATAMVRDVDLLLVDTANMNAEQQQFAGELKRFADLFLTLYNELSPQIVHLGRDSGVLIFDLRRPLSNMTGYCDLLSLTEEVGALSEAQLQVLQQIKAALNFIHNAFAPWIDK